MTLKQIIIVGEDGSKCTIRTSEDPYQSGEVVDGKLRVELGVSEPLSSVLRRLLKEEWRKACESGARLVTKIAHMHNFK